PRALRPHAPRGAGEAPARSEARRRARGRPPRQPSRGLAAPQGPEGRRPRGRGEEGNAPPLPRAAPRAPGAARVPGPLLHGVARSLRARGREAGEEEAEKERREMNAEVVPLTPLIAPVEKTVRVACAPARAFEVFTAQIARWWPLATHTVFDGRATRCVLPPR